MIFSLKKAFRRKKVKGVNECEDESAFFPQFLDLIFDLTSQGSSGCEVLLNFNYLDKLFPTYVRVTTGVRDKSQEFRQTFIN